MRRNLKESGGIPIAIGIALRNTNQIRPNRWDETSNQVEVQRLHGYGGYICQGHGVKVDCLTAGSLMDIRTIIIRRHGANLVMRHIKRSESVGNVGAEMAEGIDQVIRSIVFENGKPIIDWVIKSDIEGKIRIEIDDYLFDLKAQKDIELPFDLIDELVEEGLKVAKLKYV